MSENFFKGKSEEELWKVIVENLGDILGNHIKSEALHEHPTRLKIEDVKGVSTNTHLLDRAGAIVNALVALGWHWDAAEWNQELMKMLKEKRASS